MRGVAIALGILLFLGASRAHGIPESDPRVVEALLSGRACVSERMSREFITLTACDTLLRSDFDGLARTAAALREHPSFVCGPFTGLTVFHQAFAEPSYPETRKRERHLSYVQFWEKARPQETLPKLARLESILGMLGATPAKDREPLILVARAKRFELEGADPEVEAASIVLSSFDAGTPDASVREALAKLQGTDLGLYASTCYARRVERRGGLTPEPPLSDEQYATLLMWLLRPGQCDSRRLLNGVKLVEARFPQSSLIANCAARLCYLSGRKDEARRRLAQLGAAHEPDAWPYEEFARARRELKPRGPARRYTLQGTGPGREYLAYVFFQRQVKQLFESHRFGELEAAARELRQRPQRFPWGLSKLEAFYAALDLEAKDDEGFKQFFATLDDWERHYPDSPTALTMRGQLLTKYAWFARGSGYADTVSEKGAKLFGQRLLEARQVLGKVKPVDPYASAGLIRVCMGLGVDPLPAFKAALVIDPDCQRAYKALAYLLLPRWHGRPGSVEKFAELAAQETGARLGMGMYALIAYASLQPHQAYRETSFSWEAIKQGFADLQERYPSEFNQRCLLDCACRLGLREQARPLFASLSYAPEAFNLPGSWNDWKAWSQDPKLPRPDEE